MNFKGAVFLLITVSLTVSGQIMMKLGIPATGNLNFKNIFTSPLLVIGSFCYAVSFFTWLQVLNILPLSIALPSMSINLILIVFASALVLGEPVTSMKLIGVTLIFGGVLFISRG